MTPQRVLLAGAVVLGLAVTGGLAGCRRSSSHGNAAPTVASSVTIATLEDTPIVIALGNYVSDPDGHAVTVTIARSPNSGSLSNPDADGRVTYTPSRDYSGADAFDIAVDDELGARGVGTITLEIEPVNDAPIANPDQATADPLLPITIDVVGNDSDVDDTELRIDSASITDGSLGGSTSLGTVMIDSLANTLVYTPPGAGCGQVIASYTVVDAAGLADSSTVTIDIPCTAAFALGAPAVTVDYAPDDPQAQAQLALTLEDLGSGIAPSIDRLEFELAYDPYLFTVASVTPTASLSSLNDGLGPAIFDVTMGDGVLTVTIDTGAESWIVDGSETVAYLTFVTRQAPLLANPVGLESSATWTDARVFVGGVELVCATSAVVVSLAPVATSSTGMHLYASGQTAGFDGTTGAGAATARVFLAETVASGMSISAVDGLSFALGHDAAVLEVVDTEAGQHLAPLNGGQGPDYFYVSIYDEGIAVAILASFSVDEWLYADSPLETVIVDYETRDDALGGTTTPWSGELTWDVPLGSPPVATIVVVGGQAIDPFAHNGMIELLPE